MSIEKILELLQKLENKMNGKRFVITFMSDGSGCITGEQYQLVHMSKNKEDLIHFLENKTNGN